MRARSLGLLFVGGLFVAAAVAASVHYSDSARPAASSLASDELTALGIPEQDGAAALLAASAAPALAAPTLAAELELIKPQIVDTPGPLDRGTATLALWASKNLSWAMVRALPTTSAALFRKDPDEERGRQICIEGTIEEIRAERNLSRRLVQDHAAPLVERDNAMRGADRPSDRADGGEASAFPVVVGDDPEWNVPGGKVFFAIIAEPDKSKPDEHRARAKPFSVEALAVRSSGTLVDGDSVRFCGILTGVVSQGGDGRLIHRAVGMFELPENTGLPPSPRPAAAASVVSAAPATSAAQP